MGENKEQRRVKESGVLSIKFELSLEIIPGIIKRINFIHP
jgi:hypothetical protein